MDLKRTLLWTIIGTGISSISTELLVVREFLTQFHGNEITISVVFFVWLLTAGLGSLLARIPRRASLNLYIFTLLILALWPLTLLILIRYMRDIFFIHGASPGFYGIIVYVTALSAPYCLATGFVLPYSQKVVNAAGYPFDSGELYQMDNIGDIFGGAIFSFILVYILTPFKVVLVCSLCLLSSLIVAFVIKKRYLWVAVGCILTATFAVLCLDGALEIRTLQRQFGAIVKYAESPYGRIVVTKEGGQHTFWESGTPLYSEADIIRAEEKIHYALCQRPRVGNVLLISGGLGETLKELGKYRPRRVDYVELDPRLTEVASELGVIAHMPWLHIENTDGRLFIKEVARRYDFIIVDLPDPDTFQINRFFTKEFIALAKAKLTPKGILSLKMKYSQNYISKIRKQKLRALYATAKTLFDHVLVIPGGEAFFLCSDGVLSADVPRLVKMRGVKTSYVEGFYSGNVTEERIAEINKIARGRGQINTDFRPVLMKITLKEWFLKQGSSPIPFIVGFAIAVVLYLGLLKKQEYILFTTGLANMGAEMLVVYTVQILYGYVYLKVGAIVTAFLFGLLPGAMLGNRYKNKGYRVLLYTDLALIGMLGLFVLWSEFFKTQLSAWVFLIYGVVFSVICGFQFPAVAHAIGEDKSPAAGCLAADLAGAAVGTFLVGTVLVPVWGIAVAAGTLILCKGASTIFFSRVRPGISGVCTTRVLRV